jgi:hypothetical protein
MFMIIIALIFLNHLLRVVGVEGIEERVTHAGAAMTSCRHDDS